MDQSFSLYEHISDPIMVIDETTTVVFVNQAYCSHFRVGLEKIKNRKLEKIEPGARILEVLRSGIPLIDDFSYVHSLGRELCASIQPLKQNGKIIGAMAVMKDTRDMDTLHKKWINYKTNQSNLNHKDDLNSFQLLKSSSPNMQQAVAMAVQAAQTNATILINGETGVGKEVMAKAIHKSSKRKNHPFIPINLASLPESLFESELFGYEDGSFTGSKKGGKKGLFEAANGGTLFLDEIGELSKHLQVKLLRVIQEQEYKKVGGTTAHPLNVRLIVATHRNLLEEVNKGNFREDFYYRLNVIPILIPPLRERTEDITFIANQIIEDMNDIYDKRVVFQDDALESFTTQKWVGNVRELANMIERIVVLAQEPIITKDVLAKFLLNQEQPNSSPQQLNTIIEQTEKTKIVQVLQETKNKTAAIKVLGISRKAFYQKLKKYNLM